MKETIYLLTGAAGYLGSSVSRSLIDKNRKVRALVLNDDPAVSRVPPEAEIFYGDIQDRDSLDKFFSVPEGAEAAVIHCAGMVTVSPELSAKLISVNVTGTRNIIGACVKHGVKKLVYISSTGAIPELPRGKVISEVDSFDPGPIVGGYGKTKAMATRLALDAVKDYGLDVSVVYPSGITGPGDYGSGAFTGYIVDYLHGRLPAGIPGSFNMVDARDLANGVIACAEKGRKGEGYIMSGSSITMRELFSLISRYTGMKETKLILPAPAARAIAAVSSFIGFFTGKPGPLTGFVIYNLSRNNVFSSEKAKRELGFKNRPIEETIRDMVLWLHRDGRVCLNVESAKNLAKPPAAPAPDLLPAV
ncbi:MAG: NAD-dependent epimerase/dehydratase family protein [Treponema sp.]|nr:NAD-dependent epimerase/dehydratase family protein [Treponema sp.]